MKISFLLILIGSFPMLAQVKDSTSVAAGKAINDKFPTTRTFDVQYDQFGSSDATTKIFGNAFEKGTVESHSRLKFAANIPFYRSASKRFFITNSFRYKREAFSFGDIQNETNTYTRPDMDFHYFANTVTATYFSILWKKPVMYNASATVDADQYHFQRLKGLASAIIVLKKTTATTITVGAMLMLDPSSIVPFAPIATYEHQFSNSPWKLDFILPQRLLLKRLLLENGRLSLGTELGSENFYLAFDSAAFKGTYELNQLELKSGISYEYAIRKSLIGTFKTGIANVLSSRITERGERTNRYVIDNKQDPQFYFNIGLSYNPF